MLKMEDVNKMDVKMIDAKVTELKKELFELRMQSAASGMEKPHVKNDIKKDIARLLTSKSAKGE